MKTNYNNGHVIDVAEMTVNEYEIAAKEGTSFLKIC